MERELAVAMANGSVTCQGGKVDLDAGAWCAHPSFKGIYIKHLITGENTGGGLSAHLVRIDPGCTLEAHAHDGQWELHEVVDGEGELDLGGERHPYHMGRMAVIPKGDVHSVRAHGEGLMLLAKFFPALV